MDLTQRDTSSCGYIGTSGGHGTQYGDVVYDAAYRQHNNDIKSSTIANHPNQGGTQMFNQQMHVSIAKQDTDRFNYRVNAPISSVPMPPSKEIYGKINGPQMYDQNINCERLDGNLLQAFKSNPYTHSLTSTY
jgi:hypothetical protein